MITSIQGCGEKPSPALGVAVRVGGVGVIALIGEQVMKFTGRVLPLAKDVLQVYFFKHKVEQKAMQTAILETVEELMLVWRQARIPTSEKRAVVAKMKVLLDKRPHEELGEGRRPAASQEG